MDVRRFIKKVIESDGNVYGVLGLGADADAESLKKAYRRLALKIHPDKCPSDLRDDCTVAFQILTRSYEQAIKPGPTNKQKRRKTTNSQYSTNTKTNKNDPMDWEWTPPPQAPQKMWTPPPPAPQQMWTPPETLVRPRRVISKTTRLPDYIKTAFHRSMYPSSYTWRFY